MADDGKGTGTEGGGAGGSTTGSTGGGGGGERTVPYDRFQEAVRAKNEALDRVKALEKETQGHVEKAATADTLASQLSDLKAQRKQESAAWEEERGLLRAGFTDPDAIDVARLLHSRLPEKDRPSLQDWVAGLKTDPSKAPKALSPWLGGDAGGSSSGASSAGKGATTTAKGNASTTTGQQTGSASRSDDPLTPEKIREIRERCQRENNWDEWKKVRGDAYRP